jgi:hypothetical protein
VIAAEDDVIGAHLTAETEALAFVTERRIIDPREEWEPSHDAVVVCGPASAHIGHVLMSEDPVIGMRIGDGGLWSLVDKVSGDAHVSPMDDPGHRGGRITPTCPDARDGQVVVHIAGLHALGSVGARAAHDVHAEPGEGPSSTVAVVTGRR